jgi:hypothetical protein
LVLDGGQLHAPVETTPRTHWIGGWVGLRDSLDAVENKKFLVPARNQPSLSSLSLSQLHQIIGSGHNIQYQIKNKLIGKHIRLTGMLNRFGTTLRVFQFITRKKNY